MKTLTLAVFLAVTGAPAALADKSHGMDHSNMPMSAEQMKEAVHAKAVINSIGDGTANVSHDPIPEIGWPAMTMDFAAAENVDLTGLKPGMSLHVEVTKKGGNDYIISQIHRPDGANSMPMPEADLPMDHSQHQMPASSSGSSMTEMDHSQHNMAAPAKAEPMAGMEHSQHSMGGAKASKGGAMAGMNHGGHQMAMAGAQEGFYAAGSGLTPSAANGGKFLSYDDLTARRPLFRDRPATREIELRLTGNMERYIWSINGKKLSEAEPLRLKYGERVRFKFVNETMMAHPMHLHGMWTIVDTGKGRRDPIKHTVSVAPGTTVYTETEVDATGQWAFHCHLSYHADAGMFRKVIVEGGPA